MGVEILRDEIAKCTSDNRATGRQVSLIDYMSKYGILYGKYVISKTQNT